MPVDGPIPQVAHATEAEIDTLLGTMNTVLADPLDRGDVLATFAGLRPLLAGADADDTSDLSRRHAIIESTSGLLSIVGGKLTTYRRMAEDAVDAVIRRDPGLPSRPSLDPLDPARGGVAAAPTAARSPHPAAWCAGSAPRRRMRRRCPTVRAGRAA